MKNLVSPRHTTSPRAMRTPGTAWCCLLLVVGCGGAVTPGSAMQMAEGSAAGTGSVAPDDMSGASTTGSTLGDPTTTEPTTADDPTRGPTTTEPTTDDEAGTTGTVAEPSGRDPVPTETGEAEPTDDVPGRDTTEPPLTFTEEQLQMFEADGWTPLDIAPVDCTSMDVEAAAVAHPEDFSAVRSFSSSDHELILDLGGVVRRVDSYLTLPATDGHQHEIVFTDEALSAILQGVSVRIRTLQPPIGATDGHGHVVTVHSCGDHPQF